MTTDIRDSDRDLEREFQQHEVLSIVRAIRDLVTAHTRAAPDLQRCDQICEAILDAFEAGDSTAAVCRCPRAHRDSGSSF